MNIYGNPTGDLKVSDLRIVSVLFRGMSEFKEYLVHRDEVSRFVSAMTQLHGPGGKNPHSGEDTTPIDHIHSAEIRETGPFWWTTPGLQKNYDPDGARLFGIRSTRTEWMSPSYKAAREADRAEALRAEQET